MLQWFSALQTVSISWLLFLPEQVYVFIHAVSVQPHLKKGKASPCLSLLCSISRTQSTFSLAAVVFNQKHYKQFPLLHSSKFKAIWCNGCWFSLRCCRGNSWTPVSVRKLWINSVPPKVCSFSRDLLILSQNYRLLNSTCLSLFPLMNGRWSTSDHFVPHF